MDGDVVSTARRPIASIGQVEGLQGALDGKFDAANIVGASRIIASVTEPAAQDGDVWLWLALAAPTGVYATATETTLLLAWIAVEGATSHEVRIRLTDGAWGDWLASDTASSHEFGGLAPGTTYNMEVRGVDSRGGGPSAATTQTTVATIAWDADLAALEDGATIIGHNGFTLFGTDSLATDANVTKITEGSVAYARNLRSAEDETKSVGSSKVLTGDIPPSGAIFRFRVRAGQTGVAAAPSLQIWSASGVVVNVAVSSWWLKTASSATTWSDELIALTQGEYFSLEVKLVPGETKCQLRRNGGVWVDGLIYGTRSPVPSSNYEMKAYHASSSAGSVSWAVIDAVTLV